MRFQRRDAAFAFWDKSVAAIRELTFDQKVKPAGETTIDETRQSRAF
jgi:hypothetical protein